MSSWFSWPSWLKKKKKVYEIPPEIDEAALTSRLDQCLRTHVQVADTPCDEKHGWKLESVVRGIKVYTACKPRKQFGLKKSSSKKVIKMPAPPTKGDIPAAISSSCPPSSSLSTAATATSASASASASAASTTSAATESPVSAEDDMDSLKAQVVKEGVAITDDGEKASQMACCKTVGCIEGICAAEATAAWWSDCWDISQNGPPPRNLQVFSKFFIIRHQITNSPGWGISARCSVFTNRAKFFDPEADRYIVQSLTVRHKKKPEEETAQLKQVLTKVDISVIFQTEFKNGKTKTSPDLTRADVRSVLIYQAELDPGGIAPLWLVRFFAKRGFPKFIENFIQHCHRCFDDLPLQLSNVAPPVGKSGGEFRHVSMAEFDAIYEAEVKRLAAEDTTAAASAAADNGAHADAKTE